MIDRILEVGSALDYITPIAALIQDVANGGGHTFLIPVASSPLTGLDIERLLRRRGVQTWGAMIVSGADKSLEAALASASPEWLTQLTTRS